MADERNELEVFRRLRRRAVDPVLVHAREVARGVAQRVAPFLFASAGRRAPREVQKAIERYRRLPEAQRAQKPLLYWLLGDGTPPYKFRKEEVQYGAPPPQVAGRQNCGNCVHAYVHLTSSTPICDLMRGVIAPQAWCNRWAPPMPAPQYVAYQERAAE